jgi:integrase
MLSLQERTPMMVPATADTPKKHIPASLSILVQHLLESTSLHDLTEEQAIHIAKSVHIDTLKREFAKEVDKAKLTHERVHDLVEQWLKGFVSIHTVRSYRKSIYAFLEWLDGKSLVDVDALTVDQYVSFINSDNMLKDNSKRQRLAPCSSFFSVLERWKILDRNPFHGAKGLPRKEILVKHADKIPTNTELDLIEQYALKQIHNAKKGKGTGVDKKLRGNVYAYLALMILRKEGLRIGALRTLKIDREGHYLGRSKGKAIHGKFDSDILHLIRIHGLNPATPFASYCESAFSVWLWRVQGSDALKKILKTKFSPHSIRHRFAIDFYGETMDVHALSQRLHHSSLLVTTSYLAGLRV